MTNVKIKGRQERQIGKGGNKDVKEMVRDIIYHIRNTKFLSKMSVKFYQVYFSCPDLVTQTDINTCINIKITRKWYCVNHTNLTYMDK